MKYFTDSLFESEDKYAVRNWRDTPPRNCCYSSRKLRQQAKKIIYENTRRLELEASVAYRALKFYDRASSRDSIPTGGIRARTRSAYMLACFTLSWKKAGNNIIVNYTKVKAEDGNVIDSRYIQDMEDFVARVLEWDLECPILDFLKYYFEKIKLDGNHVPIQRIKEIILDSIQHFELSSYRPSTIVGAAIHILSTVPSIPPGLDKTPWQTVGKYCPESTRNENMEELKKCIPVMREMCQEELISSVPPPSDLDIQWNAFQTPIVWAADGVVKTEKKRGIQKLMFWKKNKEKVE